MTNAEKIKRRKIAGERLGQCKAKLGHIEGEVENEARQGDPRDYWKNKVYALVPQMYRVAVLEDYINKYKNLLWKYKISSPENDIDIEQVKKIPIEKVLEVSGIVITKGLCKCPFHNEKTPSFKIYPNNTYFCWGCKDSGDVITLVRKLEDCDFKTALSKLSDMY